ncbi:ribulose-phosphate 3-epimerase [Robiginitalea aurantiaca]|uniref:Ribulose-phosphate 3-epimerase n=1 Tax=Robiginitalea aurantiaca TaxID=3056915 RepID=A0ABT7WIM7_9FLAO|nr:ribulose-phosphate 3-epimerase [Robiginitalea aurantiaca]MDM9632772.1 ribulose-phosphate 3-epimerase [Robiginitalea aurantiaca]
MKRTAKIAPSLLAADFGNLDKDVKMVEDSQATWHHLDVMDGVFVPNISYGTPVVKAIRKAAKKPLDAHLMIVKPERYIDMFADLGVDNLTVHYEACPHLHRTLQAIRDTGMKAGIALNPHTPVSLLENSLEGADLICIMSVNPGFGGQSFIPNTYEKVRELRSMIDDKGLDTLIEIDGGVTLQNTAKLLEAGADVLVAGSFVFNSEDPEATIARMASVEVY